MKLYGIKPYRRRGRKWRKKKKIEVIYQNLLLTTFPSYRYHIWAADFTELWWKQRKIYVATVIDIFTREIVGMSVSLRKGVQLTIQALWAALFNHSRPAIFHSDNGMDYDALVFKALLEEFGSRVSRSHPGCPWENGYQESFYSQFKVDLGDPNRFEILGELIYAVYQTIHSYNRDRLHTKLKMPPAIFAERHQQRSNQLVQSVS
jgi:transposase InsO family protein